MTKLLSGFFTLLFCIGHFSCTPQSETSDPPYQFKPFPFLEAPPNTNERLCLEAAQPDLAEDTIFIDCAIEGESYIETTPQDKNDLLVVAYNIERGFKAEEQLDALETIAPDILLLSEVDRGCDRTNNHQVAQIYAKKLKMSYVYAVEFVELTRHEDGTHTSDCEHGNAILSHYPIGNVQQIRHATQESWFEAGESRLGGRIAIAADIQVGTEYVRVYAVHFESNIPEEPRNAQALEIAEDGLNYPIPVVVGGDFNSGYLSLELELGGELDQTARQFTELGYYDAHQRLPLEERITAPTQEFILDLLMSHPQELANPGVGAGEIWDGLSDHRPVWGTLKLD